VTRDQRRDLYEAIGLVAVVGSLIFVALEVRQANLATLVAARDSATQGHIDYMALLIDSTVLASASAKAAANQELNAIESKQYTIFHELRWRHYERVYYLYKNGVFSDQEWAAYRTGIAQSFVDQNAVWKLSRGSWEKNRAKLSADFVTYVDRLVKELE
jgi:hypothetical protein